MARIAAARQNEGTPARGHVDALVETPDRDQRVHVPDPECIKYLATLELRFLGREPRTAPAPSMQHGGDGLDLALRPLLARVLVVHHDGGIAAVEQRVRGRLRAEQPLQRRDLVRGAAEQARSFEHELIEPWIALPEIAAALTHPLGDLGR
ncbi:hypothetical protein QU38_01945, partial [Staphylococcus aureus]